MITVWYWLRWFFSTSGIQYTGREPYQLRLFGRNVCWINRHPGVGYLPHGPTATELVIWETMERLLRRTFKPYRCKVCGTNVWSYKVVDVCESFRCFKASGGKWRAH